MMPFHNTKEPKASGTFPEGIRRINIANNPQSSAMFCLRTLLGPTMTIKDDHKPSVPRPVLAIDYSRTPYHNSLSPPIHTTDAKPKSPTGEAEQQHKSVLVDHTQPINPDIPIKDVLFVFSNFASYMKAPNQGATGVSDQELRHASRLLEHVRVRTLHPPYCVRLFSLPLQDLQKRDKRSRVYVLHIKYRFVESSSAQACEKRIPPPFATMLDPVLKIDQRKSHIPSTQKATQ